jgi:hypothetical protein
MMNANHLLEDEVDYELRIRKVVVGEAETIPNKQRLLRAALRPVSGAEQQISITMQEDPESEFFVVNDKMKYITTVLEESGAKAKDFATLEARMIHLFSRLDRIRLLVGENRKFDITVSMSAIKKLLQLYFPKSGGFPEGKKPQSSKLDVNSGAVKKTVASPKIADPFSETNLVQDPLNVVEDTLQNLKLDEHPFLQVESFSKMSTKEQEKYLQAMRTLQYLKAKVGDRKLLEEMENLDNSVELPEQENVKMAYEAKITHNESQDQNQNSMGNIDAISKEVNENSKYHKTIGANIRTQLPWMGGVRKILSKQRLHVNTSMIRRTHTIVHQSGEPLRFTPKGVRKFVGVMVLQTKLMIDVKDPFANCLLEQVIVKGMKLGRSTPYFPVSRDQDSRGFIVHRRQTLAQKKRILEQMHVDTDLQEEKTRMIHVSCQFQGGMSNSVRTIMSV